jgi:RNA polymerase sigma factor (TIGR02999 family)
MADNPSLTQRLQMFMQGDSSAADGLLRELLPKLRQIATRELKDERHISPVSPTELINELWVSSLSSGGWQIRDQGHFFALASLAMRRVLVDLARKRLAVFRGSGEVPLSLDHSPGLIEASVQDSATLVEIGILMDQLDAADPDAARIVDMRYFVGYTMEEIAKETGLTLKQVRTRWNRGMKWLKQMLNKKARGNSAG